MVGVPANASCNMKRDFGIEAKKRGDLIGNDLGRMIVTVIHKRQTAVMRCGKRKSELCTACGETLNADTEYF